MSFLSFLDVAGSAPSSTGSFLSLITTVVMMIAIFYFFLIRPQSKRQKETEKMLAALKKGDKVVTIGGIHGTITSVKEKENTIVLKVDDNTKIEFNRTAIASVEKSEASSEKKIEESSAEEAAEEVKSEKKPAGRSRAKKEK